MEIVGGDGKPPPPFFPQPPNFMDHSKKKTGGSPKGRMALAPILAASLLLTLSGGVIFWKVRSHSEKMETTTEPFAQRVTGLQKRNVREAPSHSAPKLSPTDPVDTVPAAANSQPPSSEMLKGMVRALWDIERGDAPMTEAQAAVWRKGFDDIVKAGAASVPAITEYLKAATDTDFTPEERQLLGFGSAREALIAALARVGGPEAVAVMAGELSITGSPREVALLALGLEAAVPGVYREQALVAARESLAMAVRGHLESFDVAPLFEVLRDFGDAGIVADLERAAGSWGHYATLALGDLPDGIGIPSLLRIAQVDANGRPNAAQLQSLQVLAQLASSNYEARSALVKLARNGLISNHVWPYLARPLAGEQARLQDAMLDSRAELSEDMRTGIVHTESGNQNLVWGYSEPLTPAEAKQHLALVKELAAATKDADSLRILDQARILIEQQSARASVANQ